MRLLSTLFMGFMLLPVQLLADTVWMKNGDRLTGEIRLLDGGKLLLQTTYGGTVSLDWKQVASLDSDKTLLIKTKGSDVERAQTLSRAEAGLVELNNGVSRTLALADITQILPPKPLIEDLSWRGNLDFGLDFKQGERDTEDYDVDLRTIARHGRWRHTLEGQYNREFRNDVKSTDNWSTDYSLDRFLTEQFFWQGHLIYKRDYVEDIATQRSLGTGPGYQFWDNELGAFSLASLVNRTDYKFRDGSVDRFYAVAMRWEYGRYFSGKSFQLYSNGELGRPLSGVADFNLDVEMGLRYKVTDWASLNIKAEKDLVSGAQGDLDETRYSIGFGVGW